MWPQKVGPKNSTFWGQFRNDLGEMPILSGMLYCSDCGAKLYQVRGKGWDYEKHYFVCASYRKIKGKCTSHQIRNVQIEEILLRELKKITKFAKEHEEEFVNIILTINQKVLFIKEKSFM